MLSTTTSKVRVGQVVSIDGKPRQIIAKRKAFKAPEYFITFIMNNQEITHVCHSNKKFMVVA